MTIKKLIKRYPACVEKIYQEAFTAGIEQERQQWEARVVSEERTGEILDEIFKEALSP